MSETYYKFLRAGRIGRFSEVKWLSCGEWMPTIKGKLEPCEVGYHLCRESDLVQWCDEELYEAEYRGERIDAGNKLVAREARLVRRVETWNERTARLFACDCAEHVLPLYERKHPKDTRPRKCIDVARRYARGNATQEELDAARAAARETAWDDAWDAARSAARETAWETAWDAARGAAWHAAGDAAWGAARGAAWHAARDAEQAWQTQRLMQYLRESEVTR